MIFDSRGGQQTLAGIAGGAGVGQHSLRTRLRPGNHRCVLNISERFCCKVFNISKKNLAALATQCLPLVVVSG